PCALPICLHLGYLVDGDGNRRGGFRGEGFELVTDGWAVVRAGEGLLVSASARRHGQSTQMDVAGVLPQIRAASQRTRQLDATANQAQAQAFAAKAVPTTLQSPHDPQKQS